MLDAVPVAASPAAQRLCFNIVTIRLAALQKYAEDKAGCSFNTCLLNQYRHGKDSVAWHSDNEKVYGFQPTIASISLGEPRDFLLRSTWDNQNIETFHLGPGDVLVMKGVPPHPHEGPHLLSPPAQHACPARLPSLPHVPASSARLPALQERDLTRKGLCCTQTAWWRVCVHSCVRVFCLSQAIGQMER